MATLVRPTRAPATAPAASAGEHEDDCLLDAHDDGVGGEVDDADADGLTAARESSVRRRPGSGERAGPSHAARPAWSKVAREGGNFPALARPAPREAFPALRKL